MDAGLYVGEEQGKFGIQHVFKEKKETVVLNSAGHLNWLLSNHVQPGQLCNVIYAGKVVIPKGTFAGKDAHNFELEVDDAPVKASPPLDVASGMDDISL